MSGLTCRSAAPGNQDSVERNMPRGEDIWRIRRTIKARLTQSHQAEPLFFLLSLTPLAPSVESVQ